MKAALVALTVTLAASFAAPQDPFPAPEDKFPQTFPGSTKEPGGGLGRYPRDRASGVYAGAEILLTFDNTSHLGEDTSGNGNDLVDTNVPNWSGGVDGTGGSPDFNGVAKSTIADSDVTSSCSGCSWTMAGWVSTEQAANYAVFGKRTGSFDTNGEFYFTFNSVGESVTCFLYTNTTKTDVITGTGTPKQYRRHFVGCSYNGSADELEAFIDAVYSGTPTDTAVASANSTEDMFLAGYDAIYPHATVNNFSWWRSASGGVVPARSVITSIYNGGVGKPCADYTAEEQTDLVYCVEWNGSIHEDKFGTNDFTTTNTPLLAWTMVGDGTSGTAYSADTDDGHLESADTTHGLTFKGDEDFTVSTWYMYDLYQSGQHYIAHNGDTNGDYQWEIRRDTGDRISFRVRNSVESVSCVEITGAPAAGEWHLFTGVYTASDRIARCYVDGVLEATSVALSAGDDDADEIFYIDDRGTVNDIGFGGALDDFAVFVNEAKDTAWMTEVMAEYGK